MNVRSLALGLARDLLLTRPGVRSVRQALAWSIVVSAGVLVLYGPALFRRVPFYPDAHAAMALELAINAEYCDRFAVVDPRPYRLATVLEYKADARRRALSELAGDRDGSLAGYCRALGVPFLNNENATMLLMRLPMRFSGSLTADGLGLFLACFRVLGILLFGYTLLVCGASALVTLGLLMVVADVQADLQYAGFSMYPLFVPILVSVASLYVLAARAAPRLDRAALLATLVVFGGITAFCSSLRTSHTPIYAAFFVAYAAAVPGRARSRWPRWSWPLLSAACFALGFAAFNRAAIRPLVPPVPVTNAAHHPVFHPLVLALAIPSNRISRGHGIAWDDSVGLKLAQSMVPDAQYLGPGHEAGLFLFYAKLWMLYPAAMRKVYIDKLDLAGSGMFIGPSKVETVEQDVSRMLSWPGVVPRGRFLQALYLLVGVVAAWAYVRYKHLLALLAALLALAAVLMHLESALIMSEFRIAYHSYLLVFTAAAVLAAGQSVVDGVAALLGGRRHPSPSAILVS